MHRLYSLTNERTEQLGSHEKLWSSHQETMNLHTKYWWTFISIYLFLLFYFILTNGSPVRVLSCLCFVALMRHLVVRRCMLSWCLAESDCQRGPKVAACVACWFVLPVRLPYQFLPLLLLALSGGKVEKSETKGFEMIYVLLPWCNSSSCSWGHDVWSARSQKLNLGRSNNIFWGVNKHLLRLFIFWTWVQMIIGQIFRYQDGEH